MNNLPRRAPGVVLLIVLGVLALMSVLAISFVSMARLEKAVSRNYVDRTRATLAAESGVEYALSRVATLRSPWDWVELGQDEITVPVGSSYAESSDTFTVTIRDESAKLNLNDSNAPWNQDTDWEVDDPDTDPDFALAPGRLSMIVARLVEAQFGDASLGFDVALALFDPGSPTARPNLPGGAFQSMDQIRELLVPAILTENQFAAFSENVCLHSWQDPNTLRPSYQYTMHLPELDPLEQPFLPSMIDAYAYDTNTKELTPAIYTWLEYQNTGLGKAGYSLEPRCPVNLNLASRELITALLVDLQGWFLHEGFEADRSTTIPLGAWQGGHAITYYGEPVGLQALKQGFHFFDARNWIQTGGNPFDGTNAVFSWDEVISDGEVRMKLTDGRHHDSGGVNMMELTRGGRLGNAYGTLRATVPLGLAQAQAVAKALYERVHTGGGQPFATWNEFELFVKNEIDPAALLPDDEALGIDVLPAAHQAWWRSYFFDVYTDLLLAMFNPNSDLNDFNPNRNMHRWVDKGQLIRYTAEFCFLSGGVIDVASTGTVRGSDGAMLSEYVVDAVARAYETVRLTTQAQFMKGLQGSADELGDYFTRSEHSTLRSFGSLSSGPQALDSQKVGYTLQSYPEPYMPFDPEAIERSDFDGQITLATLDHNPTLPQTSVEGCFNDRLRPRVLNSVGGLATDDLYYTSDTPNRHFAEGCNQPTENPVSWARDPKDMPGVLYPDGAYSDAGRVVGFRAANFYVAESGFPAPNKGYTGTLSMWIKPNFHTGVSTRIRKFWALEDSTSRCMQNLVGYPSNISFCYFPHDFAFNNIRQYEAGHPSEWHKSMGKLGGAYWDGIETITTRCLAMHWNIGGDGAKISAGSMQSFKATHDYPDSADPSSAVRHHDFEHHAWTHAAMTFSMTDPNAAGSPPYGYARFPFDIHMSLTLNGYKLGNARTYAEAHPVRRMNYTLTDFGQDGELLLPSYVYLPADGSPNYLRLGEYPNGDGMRYMADSTVDEFNLYPLGTDHDADIALMFGDGRYLSEGVESTVGVYTSPAWSLRELLPAGRLSDRYVLRSVAWTCIRSSANRAGEFIADSLLGVAANPADRVDPAEAALGAADPALAPDWLSIDLSTRSDVWCCGPKDAAQVTVADKQKMPSYAGGSAVDAFGGAPATLEKDDRLRFRVYFNLDTSTINPVYEPPVFDDITFLLVPMSSTILSWKAN